MNELFLLLFAFAIGFIASIPVGASQIEIAKRVISGNMRAASKIILGSVTSDTIYGLVAIFGIAPFMRIPWVTAAFDVAGAILLWVLAFLTLRESRKAHGIDLQHSSLADGRLAFVTGFTLAISNPPIILMWLFGVSIAQRLGLGMPFSNLGKILFVIGGVSGLGGYLALMAAVMHRVKRSIPARAIERIYFWLGITLILLSLFFVYGAVKQLVPGL